MKERFRDYRLLGDIDEAGTALSDVLADYLDGFEAASADGERVVRCIDRRANKQELTATFLHGQSGVVADIVNKAGKTRLRQVATDTHNLRCSSLFSLPPESDAGWLAVQINAGRGIKGLLEIGLITKFRNQFPDLILEIRPFVRVAALEKAIEDDMVSKVKLIRYERPHDRAVAATNKWVKAGEYGKLELDITMRGRGKKLKANLLKRFIRGDSAAFGDIVEFGGLEFERAKIEVDVDGSTRTFNIETPESGHPMTVDLEELEYDKAGDPKPDSVVQNLRTLLQSVA